MLEDLLKSVTCDNLFIQGVAPLTPYCDSVFEYTTAYFWLFFPSYPYNTMTEVLTDNFRCDPLYMCHHVNLKVGLQTIHLCCQTTVNHYSYVRLSRSSPGLAPTWNRHVVVVYSTPLLCLSVPWCCASCNSCKTSRTWDQYYSKGTFPTFEYRRHTHTRTHAHTHTWTHEHTHTWTHIHTRIHTYTHTHMRMYIYMYIWI